jgi:hypothetical protein
MNAKERAKLERKKEVTDREYLVAWTFQYKIAKEQALRVRHSSHSFFFICNDLEQILQLLHVFFSTDEHDFRMQFLFAFI